MTTSKGGIDAKTLEVTQSVVTVSSTPSMPPTNGSGFGPDPAIFVIDLQDVNKN